MLVSAASESPIMKARALNLNSKDIYVDFTEAIFRTVADEAQCPCSRTPLSATLVYRPALFRRNEIRWIAAYAWRSNQRTRGLAALKQAKEALDASILKEAATSISGLIHEIFGDKPVDAITGIPCGHSRRADCFGKQLARLVASMVGLPFLQIFADRPCPGSSHPKQSMSLPPLQQIADPPRSMIIIDDLATSGWHLEESVLALRQSGVAASSIVWISGASGGVPIASRRGGATPEQTPAYRDRTPRRDSVGTELS
jgi:predicted amidophosphoribosyltransferase